MSGMEKVTVDRLGLEVLSTEECWDLLASTRPCTTRT